MRKKKSLVVHSKVDPKMFELHDEKDEMLEINGGKKKGKRLRDKKRKGDIVRKETEEFDTRHINEDEDKSQSKDKTQKSRKKKRKNVERINDVDTFDEKDDETLEINGGKKKGKRLRDKKRKGNIDRKETEEFDTLHINEDEDKSYGREYAESEQSKDKSQKSRKKKRKNVGMISDVDTFDEKDDASEQGNGSKPEDHFANSGGLNDTRGNSESGKSKKSGKKKKKKQIVANDTTSDKLLEKREEDAEDEVYQMSSGDEDYSKGMKKWITQYHQSRPGLKVLQERIDDFIMAHEAKGEQARAEKEAQAAEGGWTVVVHHKGRKKTTDAESGIAVGSVAQAAVLDKMGKKKKKETGLDFYRFQKREAHRNEIMMLQSKFEQDKKRIQQMRAARKFRPY